MDKSTILYGELYPWPAKDQLAAVLQSAGLRTLVGRYSIRIEDCSHFIFQEYGGDLGEPVIEADADSPEIMIRDAQLVSDALVLAGIKHRFEIHNSDDALVAYFHYEWPLGGSI